MFKSKFREDIINRARIYFADLDQHDFSHGLNHAFRVEKLGKRIGESESANLLTIEAMSLLHDVARKMEDDGLVDDHAQEGAKIAERILSEIKFPSLLIQDVSQGILTHRKSTEGEPKTLEAKILQDADYLDDLGAVAVTRALASAFQSAKYKRPVFVEDFQSLDFEKSQNKSTIHYLIFRVRETVGRLNNFNTNLGNKIAKERVEFSQNFIENFLSEWNYEGKNFWKLIETKI